MCQLPAAGGGALRLLTVAWSFVKARRLMRTWSSLNSHPRNPALDPVGIAVHGSTGSLGSRMGQTPRT
jgi:hypothetical protein